MMGEQWPGGPVLLTHDPERSALVIVDMQRGYTDRDNVRGSWMRENYPRSHSYFFDRVDMVTDHLQEALEAFRRRGRPVVHVTFGWQRPDRGDLDLAAHRLPPAWAGSPADLDPFRVGGDMHRIVDALAPRDGEVVLNKTGHSAFTSTPIDSVLRTLGVSQVVVGGWATSACVELTARDAADRGYETFLVEDACAGFTPESHDATIRNFSRLCGSVVSTRHLVGSMDC